MSRSKFERDILFVTTDSLLLEATNCLIDCLLAFGAGALTTQRVNRTVGINAVGQEDIDHVLSRIDPKHRTRKTIVSETLLRCRRCGISVIERQLGRVAENRAVEAQTTTVTIVGILARSPLLDGLTLQVALATVRTAIEQHLDPIPINYFEL